MRRVAACSNANQASVPRYVSNPSLLASVHRGYAWNTAECMSNMKARSGAIEITVVIGMGWEEIGVEKNQQSEAR